MITMTTKLRVDGLTGREVTDFLLRAGDSDYQAWWPGTHFQFHTVRRAEGEVGSRVHFEELVGRRFERTDAEVVELSPGRRLVWRLRKGVPLPVWIALELEDDAAGVTITQHTRAGFKGAGRVLDPLWRLYFTRDYARALDEHARAEFPMLRDLLHAHP